MANVPMGTWTHAPEGPGVNVAMDSWVHVLLGRELMGPWAPGPIRS